jgi:Fe2+ transport system protein FeoA
MIFSTQNDVRPGLLHKHGDKRLHEKLKLKAEEKQKQLDKSNEERRLEETNREAGLSREIGAENIGFKMMEKMGFKPGSSIGKSSTGLKAPIRVEVKRGRGCLGENTVLDEKRKKLEESADPDAYRARLQAATALKVTMRDLYHAQRACQNLDSSGVGHILFCLSMFQQYSASVLLFYAYSNQE